MLLRQMQAQNVLIAMRTPQLVWLRDHEEEKLLLVHFKNNAQMQTQLVWKGCHEDVIILSGSVSYVANSLRLADRQVEESSYLAFSLHRPMERTQKEFDRALNLACSFAEDPFKEENK